MKTYIELQIATDNTYLKLPLSDYMGTEKSLDSRTVPRCHMVLLVT